MSGWRRKREWTYGGEGEVNIINLIVHISTFGEIKGNIGATSTYAAVPADVLATPPFALLTGIRDLLASA